jgi:hypothetical protein
LKRSGAQKKGETTTDRGEGREGICRRKGGKRRTEEREEKLCVEEREKHIVTFNFFKSIYSLAFPFPRK